MGNKMRMDHGHKLLMQTLEFADKVMYIYTTSSKLSKRNLEEVMTQETCVPQCRKLKPSSKGHLVLVGYQAEQENNRCKTRLQSTMFVGKNMWMHRTNKAPMKTLALLTRPCTSTRQASYSSVIRKRSCAYNF